MKTKKDFRDLYFKRYVFLADMFDKFRNNSLNNHGLVPSHYLNAPDLSCDVMFNMTS